MTIYNNKNVLVAGGTGTIGIPLVRMLLKQGANVTVVSMDTTEYANKVLGTDVRFHRSDLSKLDNCLQTTKGQDFVFNLVGIKGSVGIGETKVASYFYPMILFQTNLMEASFRNSVSRYMFISSICAYPVSDRPKKEEELWSGLPKQNDRFPGLAKRIGEIQGETYLHEHGWDAVRIIRPSNVYGPFDDFNPATAQVIPSLIARMVGEENPVKVWGNGSVVRDFIYSEECAYWLTVALEKAPACTPINLGSGVPITIKEVAETIADSVSGSQRIEWDSTKPSGDQIRLLDMQRAREVIGFDLRVSLEEGIQKTVEWYSKNGELAINKGHRYYGK
jgi:GDP-L-fucose synthase